MANIRNQFEEFFRLTYSDFTDKLAASLMNYDPEDTSYEIVYDVIVDDAGDERLVFIKFTMDHDNKIINIVRKSNCELITTGTAKIKMLSNFGQTILLHCNNCYAEYLAKQEKLRKREEERRMREDAENRKVSEALGNFFEAEIEEPDF